MQSKEEIMNDIDMLVDETRAELKTIDNKNYDLEELVDIESSWFVGDMSNETVVRVYDKVFGNLIEGDTTFSEMRQTIYRDIRNVVSSRIDHDA